MKVDILKTILLGDGSGDNLGTTLCDPGTVNASPSQLRPATPLPMRCHTAHMQQVFSMGLLWVARHDPALL